MKILFDHQTFSLQNFGGISRYFTELIQGINKSQTDKAHLSLLYTDNIYMHDKYRMTKSLMNGRDFPRKLSVQYRINKLFCYYELGRKDFDIFHATYYDPYFINRLRGKPYVVTFLDMIHERFACQFKDLSADRKITGNKKRVAQEATAIIAISENTKQDIVELFDIDANKISVIHLGNSIIPHIKSNNSNIDADFTPFLLFVGRRDHYKNFNWFVQTIASLLRDYKLNVICAGGGDFSADERNLLISLKIQNYVIYQSVDDNILSSLYEKAIAFIFPSLYEGFGLPILEAFACGCPCIVSNSSSLPEVAGEAALYINLDEPDSLINAVELILHNSSLRESLVSKGKEQLTKFSWNDTVENTLNLYRTL